MTGDEFDLMTPAEVAVEFRLDRETCYSWRRRGFGPASFKVGRHVRYRRADVLAWLAAQEQATARGGQVAS